MKRLLLIEVEVDCANETCGECRFRPGGFHSHCCLFNEQRKTAVSKGSAAVPIYLRHPKCIEAERKATSGHGHWFFQCTEFDNLENDYFAAIYTPTRVELTADTEEQAIEAGKKAWAERLARGTYHGWDKKTYPRDPEIVYEVPLEPLDRHPDNG